MKIKVRMDKIYLFCVLLFITKFIGFINYMPGVTRLYSVDYIFVCLFLLACVFIFVKIIREHRLIIPHFFFNAMLLLLLIMIEIIISYIRYRQPIILVVKESFYLIVAVFTYFSFLQFARKTELENYLNWIVRFSLISSVVAIIVFYVYTYTGVNILKLVITEESFRNDTIRFGIGGCVLYFGLIISITKVWTKSWEKLDIVNIFVGVVQMLVVSKTRSILLYFIVLIMIIVLVEFRIPNIMKGFIGLLIISILIISIFTSDSLNSGIGNLIESDAGIAMRMKMIVFYMNQFIQHPLFGMGFISSSKDIAGWQYLYGPNGRFYRGDVGIIGLINEFGLVGVSWCISFFSSLFYKLKKRKDICSKSTRNLLIFMLVSIINLSFLDAERCMYIFFAYIIVDLVSKKSKQM